MNNSKSDFTQGSILGKMITFMMPILGALILQAAYGAVDLLVVGRFGTTEGLSAVSTGSQVLNLVTFVITQFAMGVTESSPNLCVNSSFSYVVLSTLLLSSKDLTEWSLVYHSTLSYQRFYDLHSIHYDHLEGLHQLI